MFEQELLAARIWSQTDIPRGRGWRKKCWIWRGSKATRTKARPEGGASEGYGAMWWHGRWWRLHRLVWSLYYEPIPEGMLIGHQCTRYGAPEDNRSCINPLHLELVTPHENLKQAWERGRKASLQREQQDGRERSPADGSEPDHLEGIQKALRG